MKEQIVRMPSCTMADWKCSASAKRGPWAMCGKVICRLLIVAAGLFSAGTTFAETYELATLGNRELDFPLKIVGTYTDRADQLVGTDYTGTFRAKKTGNYNVSFSSARIQGTARTLTATIKNYATVLGSVASGQTKTMHFTSGQPYTIKITVANTLGSENSKYEFTVTIGGTGGNTGGGDDGTGGGGTASMVGVTFDANGGYFYDGVWTTSNLGRFTKYYAPGSRILSSAPLCAKAGCSFVGWYTAGGTQLSGTAVASSPTTYYARWLQPDLFPHAKSGWSAPLVVSASRAKATTDTASSFTDMDNLYVSWAVVCSGAGVGTRFYNSLYVDNMRMVRGYPENTLSAGNHTYEVAYSIGKLSVGTHTIKIVADEDDNIAESNEGNNTYTRTITVTRAPGSCADSAVSFTMPTSVVKYDVALVREWCSSSYSNSRGVFYATTTLSRGKLYTIAMPKTSVFDVTCTDSKVVVTYGFDDGLAYYLIDTRGMSAYSTKATLAVSGSVGARATVYVVAADYMPLGNWDKPEVLPASSADGQFRYDVTRNLRSGIYSFSLNAVAGMRYEMRVSGRRGLALNIYSGVVDVLDQSKGEAFHRIIFSCPRSGKVTLDVSADETGPMSVMWFGVSGSRKFKLAFDGNGGSVPLGWTRAAYGDKVGTLPVPVRPGHIFGGWFTARAGGTHVTSETAMSVASDLTLYAHWTALAAGSCEDAAIGFAMTDSVKTYTVSLTQAWRSDMRSYEEAGVLCCATTVARGRLYTIAMPLGSDFDVDCEDDGAVVMYGEDDALAYYLIDTRKMFADSAKVHLRITGDVGERVMVYVVAGDY